MMKFSVNAQEMKAAMSLVNKAIAGKPTLPIMSCVKLEQDADGNLTADDIARLRKEYYAKS